MTFGEAVVSAFTQYAVFTGRARRSEFWYFHLFNALVIVCLYCICSLLGYGVGAGVVSLYSLAVTVPRYALIWRRLQDTVRNGFFFFFVLVPVVGWFVLLIWLCMEGQRGPNAYGPDPRETGTTHDTF